MNLIIIIFGCVLGAVFGSFACCQAWRIRLKETGKKDPGKRSVCLECGKQLKWYENIPIVSWVLQRGKCRKCGKDIGKMEIIMELAGLAVFGLLAYMIAFQKIDYPLIDFENIGGLEIFEVFVLVAALVVMMILAVYDAKWRELPTILLISLIGIGVVFRGGVIWNEAIGGGIKDALIETVGAVGILGGIYYLLYFFSKEKLVGAGDWMLGVGIGFMIGDWWLAIWILFLANFVGAAVMLPQKKKKIAFGPFLVIAFVIVFLFQNVFLSLM